MNKIKVISAMLLAAPVSGVLPSSINYAYANVSGHYGLYISRPITVRVLGMSREVRVGIRVVANANDGRSDPFCTPAQTPDTVTLEILDSNSLQVLETGSRFMARGADDQVPLHSSMTHGCRVIRYTLDFNRTGRSLKLHFNWDSEKGGVFFRQLGDLDIREGEVFTKTAN